MKIDRLTRLFGNVSSNGETSALSSAPQKELAAAGQKADSAAKFSADFGTQDASRKEKISKIKEQVDSGSYNPDSREVASALLRDLG